MALNLKNLKRKREGDTLPRKTPRLSDDDSEPDVGSEALDDDGEEWGGIGQPATQPTLDAENNTKAKLPPTGQELREINNAQDLYRSNTFKLQIDALLPNIRPKDSKTPPLDRFLLALHAVLIALPSVAPQHPLEAARKLIKKGVVVPYCLPRPTEDTNWKVAFEKPTDITVVGSWPNKVSVKGKDGVKFGVDVAVEMPPSLFQEKDYLNGRFFHKRAFYLGTLAFEIQASKALDVDVTYESALNDPRLTKLVLLPRNGSPNDFTKLNARVCIIPVLSSDSPIPLHRLSPSHSNIRVSNDEDAASVPTPIYNSALLTALVPKRQLLSTFVLKEHTPAFSDALALLRVWANQRGYGDGTRACVRGFDGLGSWWAVLLGLLVYGEESQGKAKRKPLGRGLSSYQLFRAALDFLSRHNFGKDAAFHKSQEGHRFPPEEYEAHHEAVLVDTSSTLNLLSTVPLGSLQLLQHDARKTLEQLNSATNGSDPFPEVFLQDQRDLATRFDAVIRVDIAAAKPRNASLHSTLDIGSPANALFSSLATLLRQGLGDRTTAIAILHAPASTRPLAQALPTDPTILYIGLQFDTQHAFRLVDHGPAAEESDPAIAERFRDFWGDKAELRRFKDGRIIESVVWDITSADERAHVPAMIVRHILQRHFALEGNAIQSWQREFDEVLKLPETVSKVYSGSGATLGFKGAMTAFDNLVKDLKALNEELPLSLAIVSATSESLRYTSVFAPVPLTDALAAALPPNARYLPAMEIVLQFEKSAKWPDELRAIQKIKLAFFERIANSLMSSVAGLKATVVVGDGICASDIRDIARLEIVTADGWAFSASIWHDREATLLDRLIFGKNALPHINIPSQGTKKTKDQQEAAAAKEVYLRRFIHAPRHHRAVAGLHHRFAAYSSTVRLVKRWLAAHWVLHGHVAEEAVELLCASVFVGDGRDLSVDAENRELERAGVPGTKERGFAKVVELLKNWKWEDGLFVPLYGGESVNAATLPASATARPGVWRISTEADREGNVWTRQSPDVIVANRIRALANATWKCLQSMEDGKLNVKSMFTHPTEDYDFIVRLDQSVLPRYAQKVDSSLALGGRYVNLPREDSPITLRPGFEPARLLYNDLQRLYADTFKIFCDPFGGDTFGAVWDPALKQPRPFRVLGGYSSLPAKKEKGKDKDKGLVVLNEGAILKEIERLGSGLISGITVQV